MNPILEKLSPALKRTLVKKPFPSFEVPMLCMLTKDYFSDPNWIFERKFDGERCFIYKNHAKVYLKSRNDKSLDPQYPEIRQAAARFKADQIILDGEVVAFKGKVTSFEKLQARIGLTSAKKALASGVRVHIYVFDILYFDGYELLKLPLMARKKILKQAVHFKDPIRYTIHKDAKGQEYFKVACKKFWEGLIAKRRDSQYVHIRSWDWRKFKCVADQELVVGGYTEPQRSRVGFGSLLLGYYKGKKFMFAGKVGTGFSDTFLRTFHKKLQKIETKKNPFSSQSMEEPGVHFVKPIYVAEIGFEEWTKENLLRQPRFQGLRFDKSAKDVVKETPKEK